MAKRAKRKAAVRDARMADSLPALSTLDHIPAFEELRADDVQRGAFLEASEADPGLELGCVVRLDRGFPAVAVEGGLFRAEFAAQLTKGDFSRVAVGDWVCVRRPDAHDMGLIEQILPRRSDIARWKGGARGERQTLAANVDSVIVVQAEGPEGPDLGRIGRSAVVARDCGARIAVVLTKADRVSGEALAADMGRIRGLLGEEVALAATSSAEGEGIEAVRALVPEGRAAIVLGESGAGKSTLLNALLGESALETGAVRESDDMGRHTTVARRMVSIPGAGIIVDEPGLRSLPLVGHERGLAKVFPDISEAASECRFRDCTHTHEPGCAVQEGISEGRFSSERAEAYLALAAEMRASALTLDPDIVL